MRTAVTSDEYIQGILGGDRILLSKAITLIESTRKEDEEMATQILEACLKTGKKSKRIAITGVPGAGKSTFINSWGKLITDSGKTVAVLAIDPSSSISKGSILADKTRMEDLVSEARCYIRPTASSSNLGGVARSTRETILLCEAFGFDYIFVETVGVGQSETIAKNMSDLFLLLLLPNAGDELQGIKRGIMEMADIVLINKSEGDNAIAAKTAAAYIKRSLHLFAATDKNWTVPVLNISALQKTGLQELQQQIDAYFLNIETTGFFNYNRQQQNIYWLEETLQQELRQRFTQNNNLQILKKELIAKINSNEITPTNAAKLLVQKFMDKI
ncbi:MAG TPA: methylmalonyl Co-A mutase-associated GTPase MeaB [Chitinophagales bacterium]|jgi:LAO/AO transport system kinase|nr:methylmalonyl Co-A mutase-associated GTPase MeaB [Chitinophagales bacterium]